MADCVPALQRHAGAGLPGGWGTGLPFSSAREISAKVASWDRPRDTHRSMTENCPDPALPAPGPEPPAVEADENPSSTCWDQVLASLELATLPIRRAALRSGIPPSDVDDVVQEALCRAWRSRTRHDGSRPLAPWLLGVGHNVIRAHLSHLGRRPRHESDPESYAPPATGRWPDPQVFSQVAEDNLRVVELMAMAPPSYRTALEAKYWKGLSSRKAASGETITLKAAERTLDRARRWLKARWGARA